jgi:hypothetical protein
MSSFYIEICNMKETFSRWAQRVLGRDILLTSAADMLLRANAEGKHS